ncbi:5-hydroxytryptamine receptor 2B-like [Littorina saxatilis]|uniref:G-protein coupled receptors family 1 profile domain-containing protein n=1 Tax=Littorina saxatilis TaxID=31220 RepID=A0AAN9G3N5_9CAEN
MNTTHSAPSAWWLERWIEGGVLTLIGSLSLVSNLGLFLILLTSPQLVSFLNDLTLALTFSDLLITSVTMTFTAYNMFVGRWEVPDDVCSAVGVATCLLVSADVFTLWVISYMRYLRVCQIEIYVSRLYRLIMLLHVIGVWVAAVVVATPPLYGWGEVHYVPGMHLCLPTSPSYLTVLFFLLYLLTALVMLYCHCQVYATLLDSLPPVLSSAPDSFDARLHSPWSMAYLPHPSAAHRQTWWRRRVSESSYSWRQMLAERDEVMVTAFTCALRRLSRKDDSTYSGPGGESGASARESCRVASRNASPDNAQYPGQLDPGLAVREETGSHTGETDTEQHFTSEEGERTDKDKGNDKDTEKDKDKNRDKDKAKDTEPPGPSVTQSEPTRVQIFAGPPLRYEDSGELAGPRLPILLHRLGEGVSRRSSVAPSYQSPGVSFMGGFLPQRHALDHALDHAHRRLTSLSTVSISQPVLWEEMKLGSTFTATLLTFLLPPLPLLLVLALKQFTAWRVPSALEAATLLLAFCHVALNPLVYGWLNVRVRRAIIDRWRRLCGRRGRGRKRGSRVGHRDPGAIDQSRDSHEGTTARDKKVSAESRAAVDGKVSGDRNVFGHGKVFTDRKLSAYSQASADRKSSGDRKASAGKKSSAGSKVSGNKRIW